MKVNRAQLLKEVESVLPGLSEKELIEQSDCIVFKDKKICTYNDEIACTYKTKMDITAAVQSKPLISLLKKMKEEEIDVSLEENTFLIKGKGRRSGIRMESKILLPIDTIESPVKWNSLPEDFTEGLKTVVNCAGNDDSQFILSCIHIHPKWIEACDNQQIGRFKIDTGFTKSILVRKDSLKHIINLDMTKFSETENWVHFKNPAGLMISCRRYVEDYPEVDDILNVSGTKTLLPKGIKDAVERAEIFSSENADDNLVTITVQAGKLKIIGEGVSGWFRESKKTEYKGNDISFRITPTLLTDLVQKHNECIIASDRMKIEIGKLQYVTVLSVPKKSKKKKDDDGDN